MPESERSIVKMMVIVNKMTLMTNMTMISIRIMMQMVNVINVLMASITFTDIDDFTDALSCNGYFERRS